MTYQEDLSVLGGQIDAKMLDLTLQIEVLTDKSEALQITVDRLTSENSRLKSDNSQLATEKFELEQEIVALEAQIADLKKQLAECEGTPPETAVVFGVSAPQNTVGGEYLATPGERIFLSPGQKPTTVASHAMLRNALVRLVDGGTLWLSIKDQAGAWLESLIADIYKVQPNIRLVMTANHEPFDNYDFRNAADWKRWQDLQVAFETVCAKFPKVEMVTIVEAYHVPSRTPGYFDAVLRPKQAFGADAYNAGLGSPKRYVPPAELHKELTEYVERVKPGQGLFIGETGTGLVENTAASAVQRTQWVADNRAYMAEHGNVAMYWNSGGPGPMDTCKLPLDDLKMWLGL